MKEACKYSSSRWAAILERNHAGWAIHTCFGLLKGQQNSIRDYLRSPDIETWVSGAISLGRYRWRATPADLVGLGGDFIYLFPAHESQLAVLVGSGSLEKHDLNLWRLQLISMADWIAERSSLQLSQAETAVLREQLCAVDTLVQYINCTDDPHQAGLFLMQKLAALFDPQCAELCYQHEGNWYSILYDFARPVERKIESILLPGQPPAQNSGQRIPLSFRGQELGYLQVESRANSSWPVSNPLHLEIFANLMASTLSTRLSD